MKLRTIAFLTLGLLAAGLSRGDNTATAPVTPAEVKLSSGVVLRVLAVIRWERDKVVVKHPGGADPVRYSNMAPESRKAFEAARDYELAKPKIAPDQTATKSEKNEQKIVAGEAFIVTKGAGNYKLGALKIYAFPMSQWNESGLGTWTLRNPIATALTDSEGRWQLKLPDQEPFFIYAQTSRLAGAYREYYQWLVRSADMKDSDRFLLTNNNLREAGNALTVDLRE